MKGDLQWTKDGFGLGTQRELPGFPRYRMVGDESAGEFSLEMSAVAPEDDAVFQCQVRSGNICLSRITLILTPGERWGRCGSHQVQPSSGEVNITIQLGKPSKNAYFKRTTQM